MGYQFTIGWLGFFWVDSLVQGRGKTHFCGWDVCLASIFLGGKD